MNTLIVSAAALVVAGGLGGTCAHGKPPASRTPKVLILGLDGVRPDRFDSDFGRTDAIGQPHEFGYFWTDLLGYPEMAAQDDDFEQSIDWQRMRRTLVNLERSGNC